MLLSITILLLTGSRPLNAISFVFSTDIVQPRSVSFGFNLYAAFCKVIFYVGYYNLVVSQ